MFFNYDSMPLVVTTIIIGGMFTYSIYSIFTISTTVPTFKEVGVQTESLVNTFQPNLDSISELPETVYPVLQPTILPDNLHVDVGVQTSTKSLYTMFKEWLRELFSINSSDLVRTPTDVRVENWIGNLDNTQVVSQDVIGSVVSNNQLPDLMGVKLGESVSNLGASNIDVSAVVEYSQYSYIGEVVVHTATNQAFIQAINSGIGFC
jgi:hypothetical protein